MTSKDYIALAAALRLEVSEIAPPSARTDFVRGRNITAENIARNVANVLAADNDRFNRKMFFRACGFPGSSA